MAITSNGDFILISSGGIMYKCMRDGTPLWSRRLIHVGKEKYPRAVCLKSQEQIIVGIFTDVVIYSRDGIQVGTLDKKLSPYGICVDLEDNILVADDMQPKIMLFNRSGTFIRELVSIDGKPGSITLPKRKALPWL